MRTLPARLPAQLFAALLVAVWLAPLCAAAEERGPGEIGHFVFIMAVFTLMFLSSLGFAVWLLVARLRSDAATAESASANDGRPAPRGADLESIWFPPSASLPTGPLPTPSPGPGRDSAV
jgi:hypothetical protein